MDESVTLGVDVVLKATGATHQKLELKHTKQGPHAGPCFEGQAGFAQVNLPALRQTQTWQATQSKNFLRRSL
jgi:hypothetical protein